MWTPMSRARVDESYPVVCHPALSLVHEKACCETCDYCPSDTFLLRVGAPHAPVARHTKRQWQIMTKISPQTRHFWVKSLPFFRLTRQLQTPRVSSCLPSSRFEQLLIHYLINLCIILSALCMTDFICDPTALVHSVFARKYIYTCMSTSRFN